MKFSIHFAWGLGLVAALAGCGGGGGSSPQPNLPVTTTVSGVAVDGYLYKAIAFLDLNGNGLRDDNEPKSTTSQTGGYTLSATADQLANHSVVVIATANETIEIDENNQQVTLTQSMTMIAPAGQPGVVSPLTTQVAAKMANGLSFQNAQDAVKQELGLSSIDVMKDYVAETIKNPSSGYADAYKIAAAIGVVLKNVDPSLSLENKLTITRENVFAQISANIDRIKAAGSVNDAIKEAERAISFIKNAATNAVLASFSGVFKNYEDSTPTTKTPTYTLETATPLAGIFDETTGVISYPNSASVAKKNVIALTDSTAANTIGTAPYLTIEISNAPQLNGRIYSQLEIAMTSPSNAKVITSLMVESIYESSQLIVRATDQQSVFVNALKSDGNPKFPPQQLIFNNADQIASTRTDSGRLYLDINIFKMLTKLENTLIGIGVAALLAPDNYTMSIIQTGSDPLPLKTPDGAQIKGVSLNIPIADLLPEPLNLNP
jgi:microcystin-dependent protein